jgi:hypothetical protein
MGSIRELVEIACHVARPKAVYETSYVENRDGDSLDIGGVTFSSRVLRVNLDGVERVVNPLEVIIWIKSGGQF